MQEKPRGEPVVDCHQHPHASVAEVMEELGIDVSVLLPVG